MMTPRPSLIPVARLRAAGTGPVPRLMMVLAMLCLGSACRPPAAEQKPDDSAAAPVAGTVAGAEVSDTSSAPVLRLERGPCYGRCPVYAVTLFADGAVHFEGREHVNSTGLHEGRIGAAEVSALTQRFREDFFALPDTLYTQDAPGCGSFVTDGPSAYLSLRDGARTRGVRLDGGCTGAPNLIRQFAAAVDSVARTASWIVGPGGNH